MTTTFRNDNREAALPQALVVLNLTCDKLFLFASPESSHAMARFNLGPYRLFRPDHDSQFTSDNGRVWRPVE